jgi:hypothetical protein
MDDELRYRAELTDQFIARLTMFSAEQWVELSAHHANDDDYYRLALDLASEATQLLGAERVTEYESVLQERMRRIDDLMREMPGDEASHLPPTASHLAKGAVHALLVRDTYGFNWGAFSELFRPFRAIVDIGDLERAATRARLPELEPIAPPADHRPDAR